MSNPLPNTSLSNNSSSYIFTALIVALLWALNPLSMSNLTDIPVFELSGLLFFSAFIGFCITYYTSPAKKKVALLPRNKGIWSVGLLCLFSSQCLYTYSYHFLNPEQVELIFYVWPVLLTVFCILNKTIRFSKMHLIALTLCSIGVYTCLSPSVSSTQGLMTLLTGSAVAISSALCWAFYFFYSKSNKDQATEYQSSLFSGPCAIFCIIIHLCTESTIIPTLSQLFIILFLGLVFMHFSLTLWNRAISHGNFKIVSLFPYLVPILSIFILVIAGHTEYSNRLIMAALLVCAGMLFPFLCSSQVEITC